MTDCCAAAQSTWPSRSQGPRPVVEELAQLVAPGVTINPDDNSCGEAELTPGALRFRAQDDPGKGGVVAEDRALLASAL